MTKSDRRQEPRPARARRFAVNLRQPFSLEDGHHWKPLLILLAVVLTVIIVPKGGFIPDYYAPGDVASRDIKAPKDLLIPDLPLTEKKRVEAEEGIRPLYDFAPRTGQDMAARLSEALESIQADTDPESDQDLLRQEVEAFLGVSLSDAEFEGIKAVSIVPDPSREPGPSAVAASGPGTEATAGAEVVPPPDIPGAIRKVIIEALGNKTVGNLQLFQADRTRGITIRNLVSQEETEEKELDGVIGLGDAQDHIRADLKKIDGLSPAHRDAVFAVIQKLLRPNLTFNKNETEARKRQAREAVKPVLFQVKKGEMIVREGERVSAEQIKKLKALHQLGNDYSTFKTAVGLLVSILLLLITGHRFAKGNISKYRPQNRDLLFLVTTFIGLFVLIKVAIFMSTALESAFPYIESSSYYYAFPFAVGAMLVRIVLNSEVALIFAILSSLLLGVLFGNSLFITFYALVGSITGAHWVRQCKQRTTLYHAGLRLSLVNALLILGIHFIIGRPFDIQLLYKLGFGLGGGLVCAVMVTGTIPLVEFLFKYTTDIKLLELANMNTPVLRELMIQAPGTYHHSIIVGNLVETAAEAINANPLLARVAAYYHDIGKIRKPLYFVENMGQEENRHDKLAPSMSALILMSHLKDGVEMARENKLGNQLVDILRQHHGTALIKFFYNKAKSKEDPGVQQVDERDYRYPGPKPQTREAALIMLADAVEAASRTLPDPTPARIQGMVQKIINNIFIDGQLDECELTLKDLHNIAKSFNRILAGIFHHRIDYPEPAYKGREKETAKRKNGEDSNREPTAESKDKEAGPKKSGPKDLKRLGMS